MVEVGLSLNDAADRLGVSRNAFRTLLDRDDRIRTFHVGRRRLVLAADLEQWAREQAGAHGNGDSNE